MPVQLRAETQAIRRREPTTTTPVSARARPADGFDASSGIGGAPGLRLTDAARPGAAPKPKPTRGLDAEAPVRAELKRLDTALRPDEKTDLAALTAAPGFWALAAADRLHVLTVFTAAPQTRPDLQILAERNDVVLDSRSPDGRTLASSLARLSTLPEAQAKLAAGVDGPNLAATVLHDLVDSSNIKQGDHFTCAAASIQIGLVLTDPARFAAIQADLASSGRAVTGAGAALTRVADSRFFDDVNDETPRSASSRLFQSAIMEAGNGPDATYSNITDRSSNNVGQGLTDAQTARALGIVYPERGPFRVETDKPAEAIFHELVSNRPVLVGVEGVGGKPGENTGHLVEVVGMTNGRVQLKDPNRPERYTSDKLDAYNAMMFGSTPLVVRDGSGAASLSIDAATFARMHPVAFVPAASQ